jgi:hypothetical protein
MSENTDIQLSGPFSAKDSSGQSRDISAIRIVDESYGMIDVYVDLRYSMEEDRLFDDLVLIKNISAHLRGIGYAGADLTKGDAGLQDDKLIVLEAPEAFNPFAERHGWKNLAAEFAEDDLLDDSAASAAPSAQLEALLAKFKSK